MATRKRIIISAIIALAALGTAEAQEAARWLRQNAISPDGQSIAFAYKGDIFTVSSKGGEARQITTNPAYETSPIWTADGRSIVFASYREGSKDIFIIDAGGGVPERLTFHPGNETPLAVLPDGSILFSASIQADALYDGFPGKAQLYATDTEGSRPKLVTSLPISNISVNRDGTVLYEDIKGYEDSMRKHHTSSVTRDIWLYRGNTGKALDINGDGSFTKLSEFAGENREPVFCPDGDSFYYTSEEGGNFNIWKSSISAPSAKKQITHMPVHPVRHISVAGNGTAAFSYNGDLYTVQEGSEPVKLDISVRADKSFRETVRRKVTYGVSGICASPDGKEIAIVARGDVYVTTVEGKTTRRITDTAGQERGVSFSKDGRTLYYAAERDGEWAVWQSSLTDKNDRFFTYSHKFEEKRVTEPGQTCFEPAVSPDGKWLAFLRNRNEIVIKNLKTGKEKSVLKGANYSYRDGDQSFEWSPDSRKILSGYQANGGWNNTDIAVIDIESGQITDLTESGYSDRLSHWAMGGKAMTWLSDKAGYRSHGSWGAEYDIYAMFFDEEAYYKFTRDKEGDDLEKFLKAGTKEEKKDEKEAKKDSTRTGKAVPAVKLELDGREDRIVRLTMQSASMGDHFLTNDGGTLFYISEGKLWKMDIKGSGIKSLGSASGRIIPDRNGKDFYIVNGHGIQKYSIASGKPTSVTFAGEFDYVAADEREYIFEHAWKQVQEKFYDPDIHGVDWTAFHDNYRQFLPYINNNFDFQILLSEMLGELNGSHTGARYRYSSGHSFGYLGAIYDNGYTGDGLKIKELLPGSILRTVDPEIKAGDIVKSIDGQEIKAGEDWFVMMEHAAGKKVQIGYTKGGKHEERFVDIQKSESEALYKRWVRRREEMVDRLSGGRIGYVHVKGMNSDSFREVYSKALGKYRNREALIVDTRHNGGGWLHDDLATLLNGKAYIEFRPRGQYIGTEPYNKWTKPSCVLIGEDNYSDACGFPYVYRSLGIGKLIGAPVPGTMTAVWWETQIDPTLIFGIPEVTSWGLKEDRALENFQIEPDILVYNDPASTLRGEDKQLETAVAEMLKEIDK